MSHRDPIILCRRSARSEPRNVPARSRLLVERQTGQALRRLPQQRLSGLSQALAIRFPATEAIVGKEFFAAMAKAYVERGPAALAGPAALRREPCGFHRGVQAGRRACPISQTSSGWRMRESKPITPPIRSVAPESLAAIASDRAERSEIRASPLIRGCPFNSIRSSRSGQ